MRCAQVRRGWEGSGAEAGARATTSPAPSHGHLSGPSSQRRPHGRRAGRAIRVRARGLRIVRSTLRHPGRPRWSANRQDGSPSGQMPAASSLGPVTRAASTTAAGPRGSVTASITVDRLERERAPDRAVLHRPGRAASRSREHLERLKGRGLAARPLAGRGVSPGATPAVPASPLTIRRCPHTGDIEQRVRIQSVLQGLDRDSSPCASRRGWRRDPKPW